MAEGEKIDYAAVVRELGYAPREATWILTLIESQRRSGDYPGFRAVLRSANQSLGRGSPFSEFAVEPVIRRVEAMEAAGPVDGRSSRRSAAQLVEEALATVRARREVAREKQERQTWLLLDMTDDELEGRARLRPQVAERWGEHFPDRPLIEGRLPTARQLERLAEMEDRVEVERLRKILGLDSAGAEPDVSEGTDAGSYSAAAAKGRADTEAALSQFFGRSAAAEQAEARLARVHTGRLSSGWWVPPGNDADRTITEFEEL